MRPDSSSGETKRSTFLRSRHPWGIAARNEGQRRCEASGPEPRAASGEHGEDPPFARSEHGDKLIIGYQQGLRMHRQEDSDVYNDRPRYRHRAEDHHWRYRATVWAVRSRQAGDGQELASYSARAFPI